MKQSFKQCPASLRLKGPSPGAAPLLMSLRRHPGGGGNWHIFMLGGGVPLTYGWSSGVCWWRHWSSRHWLWSHWTPYAWGTREESRVPLLLLGAWAPFSLLTGLLQPLVLGAQTTPTSPLTFRPLRGCALLPPPLHTPWTPSLLVSPPSAGGHLPFVGKSL